MLSMEVGNEFYRNKASCSSYYKSYYYTSDGIIIGGSSLQHVTDNLDATNDGPLDPSEKYYQFLPLYIISVGVVKAIDQAWQWDKANCATYYR